jgi:hypothetical protein
VNDDQDQDRAGTEAAAEPSRWAAETPAPGTGLARDAHAEVATLKEDGNRLLVGGATLGTFAVVTSALFAATCPMCVVVAPAMLGAGAVQRWRASRKERMCLEAAAAETAQLEAAHQPVLQRDETPDGSADPA